MAISWKLGEDLVLQAAEKHIERLTKVFTNRVMELTPVGNPELWKTKGRTDPHPGLLKASWKGSYDAGTKTGTVMNPQPYAYRIEYGWSTQAPYGMVRVAIKELGGMLTQVVNSGSKI